MTNFYSGQLVLIIWTFKVFHEWQWNSLTRVIIIVSYEDHRKPHNLTGSWEFAVQGFGTLDFKILHWFLPFSLSMYRSWIKKMFQTFFYQRKNVYINSALVIILFCNKNKGKVTQFLFQQPSINCKLINFKSMEISKESSNQKHLLHLN